MHKAELVARIAEQAGITKIQAQDSLNAITDSITDTLAKGEDVTLIGFGSFSQRRRAARQGKNPQTGEAMQIAASNSVAFRPGKALKDSCNR